MLIKNLTKHYLLKRIFKNMPKKCTKKDLKIALINDREQ